MKRLRDGRQARPLGANGDTTGHPSGDQLPEVPASADEPTTNRARGWIVDPNGPSASRQAQLRRVGEATLRQPDRMPWGQRAADIQGWIDRQTQDPGTDAEEEVEPDGRFATAGVRSAPNRDVAAMNRRCSGVMGLSTTTTRQRTPTSTRQYATLKAWRPRCRTKGTDTHWLAGTNGTRPFGPSGTWPVKVGQPPLQQHTARTNPEDGAGPHYSDVSHASDAGERVGPQRDDGGSDSRSLMSLGFAPQANQQWAPANPSGSDDVPPPLVAAHAGLPPQRPDEGVVDFDSEESLPLEYGEMADPNGGATRQVDSCLGTSYPTSPYSYAIAPTDWESGDWRSMTALASA
ncbi:uncharacterized protein LOC117190937 [Drosophila miranda]|uniref:uncharacterized protein LOC117190937 n=1 Tax=Drosophila miranda TaxID=7229 RepID=UPI00143F5091|nr:uncharacterized protein LOC117190937 [Drosophila miranda]